VISTALALTTTPSIPLFPSRCKNSARRMQHVRRPTHLNQLLDIITTDDSLSVSEKQVDDASCISDHGLLIVLIDVQSSAKKSAAKNYPRISDINPLEYEIKLRASSLSTSATSTVEAFAERMEKVVVSTLDELAPLCNIQTSAIKECIHGGCRQQPLTLNVHAGISNGKGAVISKSRTGLRIVVRADLLVTSAKTVICFRRQTTMVCRQHLMHSACRRGCLLRR
jgi:hypothetical protein